MTSVPAFLLSAMALISMEKNMLTTQRIQSVGIYPLGWPGYTKARNRIGVYERENSYMGIPFLVIVYPNIPLPTSQRKTLKNVA